MNIKNNIEQQEKNSNILNFRKGEKKNNKISKGERRGMDKEKLYQSEIKKDQ